MSFGNVLNCGLVKVKDLKENEVVSWLLDSNTHIQFARTVIQTVRAYDGKGIAREAGQEVFWDVGQRRGLKKAEEDRHMSATAFNPSVSMRLQYY